eukprot:SAG22_NODE_7_length_40155_cov_25.241356_22_plen_142_part_00
MPVPLHRTLTPDGGPTIQLHVGPEDLAAATSLELRLRLTEWTPQDRLRLEWDAAPLAPPTQINSAAQGGPHFDGVGDATPMGDVWLVWAMRPEQVAAGVHVLAAGLLERHPRLAAVLTLTDVELVVRYGALGDEAAPRSRL